ncbi:PREDICTED: uncharacterized protein LOC105966948 [Erythranthe guttata]|uniref:uncharacterized protein LOC105966948 n=1 Tax=Erythranthe guttata TaxID=4155 RepID=UPI00064DC327|nr:PREDICTED: uncharacterized protein LOC105966948 [Erythranthe guttata]|eukprot:XP_012846973.1 PREDICTED: uncharacterized protein LOC105966948 [Erythranthe guttata]
MTPNISNIVDLSSSSMDWRVIVRVMLLWFAPHYENKDEIVSLDMLLMDSKGGKIDATIKKQHMNKFKALLKEGKTYMLCNFMLGPNSGNTRITTHQYKIISIGTTTITSFGAEQSPSHHLLIKSLDMLHREGASTVRPPLLDGSNYSYRKSKMKMFIKSVDERAWRAIVTGWTPPMAKGTDGTQTVKPEEAWTNEEILLANYNSRAINSIFNGVGDNQFKLIASCESAKKAWEILQVTYEGTSTVKTSKLQMLATRFESLHMEEDETIADFHAKLCDISNESYALGEQYSETKLVRKALRSLPERFAYRVAAIEEVRDINTLKLDELMGKLQTQEMNFRANIREKKKVKNVAFQAEASHGISQGQTFHECDIDVEESLAIMSNNLESLRQKIENRENSSQSGKSVNPNKFQKFSNNGYFGDAKSRRKQCRECGGFGHIQAECANTLKKNKMSLTTVWSDKEDSDEDENNKGDQTTNFMAFSGTTSMSRTEGTVAKSVRQISGESESSSDDEEPTLEEVKDVYEKMYRKWLEVSEVNKRLEKDKHVLIEENKVLKVRISTLEQNVISSSREIDSLKAKFAQTQDVISKFNTGRATLNEILNKNQPNYYRIGLHKNIKGGAIMPTLFAESFITWVIYHVALQVYKAKEPTEPAHVHGTPPIVELHDSEERVSLSDQSLSSERAPRRYAQPRSLQHSSASDQAPRRETHGRSPRPLRQRAPSRERAARGRRERNGSSRPSVIRHEPREDRHRGRSFRRGNSPQDEHGSRYSQAEETRRHRENGNKRNSKSPRRETSRSTARFGTLPARISPFIPAIMEEVLPLGLRIPNLPQFDETGDPQTHLNNFFAKIDLYGLSDAAYCKIFQTTLTDQAQTWFNGLPGGSLDGLGQLSERFLSQYSINKRYAKTGSYLFKVKQREGEPLRDYVQRFVKAVHEVPNVNHDLLADILQHNLRHVRFQESIAGRPPQTLEELLNRAEKFIRIEEAVEMGLPVKRKREEERHEAKRKEEGRSIHAPTYPKFTPLKAKLMEVWMVAEQKDLVQPPRQMKENPKRQKSEKYCEYHQDRGHTTDECFQLKQEIERLIKKGRLGEFVDAPRHQNFQNKPRFQQKGERPNPRKDQEDDNLPTQGILAVISGGPSSEVTFSDDDLKGPSGEHNDALVISASISNYLVNKILVDGGSSADIIYYDAFEKLGIANAKLAPVKTPLVGFTGHAVEAVGEISLVLSLGSFPCRATNTVNFLVVKAPSTYNVILGRPSMNLFRAIPSTYHMKLKFPTASGVGEAVGDQRIARECYANTLKAPQLRNTKQVGGGDDIPNYLKRKWVMAVKDDFITPSTNQDADGTRLAAVEELKSVEFIPGDQDKLLRVGTNLEPEAEARLVEFLRRNGDIFASRTEDLEGIPPSKIVHRLDVDPKLKPVKQKKRPFGPERNKHIKAEVGKLLAAGQIRPVQYPEWLSNVVLVAKSGGKWRLCVDFTNLNNACPKDPFPLPRIDQLVDSTSGCELLSFLDAYQGYNQIQLAPEDQEKASFITDQGIYCYKVMPFGLKNAGATYQRLVNTMFADLIGRNMEVYIDDMLVKSAKAENHLKDLEECFAILREYKMKLNPSKCSFGLKSGKFLGYMISQRGIEANPAKIDALINMAQPKSIKNVQQLNGCLAALNRFISRSADKGLPFFRVLREGKNFKWTEECQKAFEELKQYLASPPLLTKPREGDELLLYLATTSEAISAVLVLEGERGHQPNYYVSHALRGAEHRYSNI